MRGTSRRDRKVCLGIFSKCGKVSECNHVGEKKVQEKTEKSKVKKRRSELQRFKFWHCVLHIYCFDLSFDIYSVGLSVYVRVVRPC